MPSVEQCLSESWMITDDCLRKCVQSQCTGATVTCGDFFTRQKCGEKRGDGRIGGFVFKGPQSCKIPSSEVQWCDLPIASSCRARAMVHELAHTCGWHDGDGHGVPGNSGADECSY